MAKDTSHELAVSTLSRLDVFCELNQEQLKQLVDLGEITSYPPDVVLFEEGDEGDRLYLILEGSLEITNKSDRQVFMLNSGDLLGEIALLDGLPRTATATTACPCKLFGLSRRQFEAFLAFDPSLAFNMMRVTNRKVRAALEREKDLNQSLQQANRELERLNETLEQMVEQKTQQLWLANQNLKEMLEKDPLTGLFNRRKLDALLEECVAQGEPFSVIMLDVDHFKWLNDTHGHQTGDRVLIKLANLMAEHEGSNRSVARYGGEEFCVVLQGTDLEAASALAEEIRASIEAHHFPIRDCAPGYVTASLGVAHYPTNVSGPEATLAAADEALYFAKGKGRNVVVTAQPAAAAES